MFALAHGFASKSRRPELYVSRSERELPVASGRRPTMRPRTYAGFVASQRRRCTPVLPLEIPVPLVCLGSRGAQDPGDEENEIYCLPCAAVRCGHCLTNASVHRQRQLVRLTRMKLR